MTRAYRSRAVASLTARPSVPRLLLALCALFAGSVLALAQNLQLAPGVQINPNLQLQQTQPRVVTIQGGGLEFLDAFTTDKYNLGLDVVIARPGGGGQSWVVTDTGNGYLIMQQSTGQYLDAHEVAAESFRVVTRPRQTSDSTQLWTLRDYGGGFYTIQQVSSGRFLTANLDAATGYAVTTEPERPGDNLQTWRLGDI